jgi:hypothetical protein
MKQRRKKARSREHTFRVWSHPEAQTVVPYLTSVMRSLREHYLEALGYRLQLKRLAEGPGRPDRDTLIEQQEAARAGAEVEARFNAALKELWHLNIYCLDPVQGLALIPFAHGDQLGWFVFNMFDQDKISAWRYHSDSLETRRPLAELLEEPPSPGIAV